jgi:hypothetical protein
MENPELEKPTTIPSTTPGADSVGSKRKSLYGLAGLLAILLLGLFVWPTRYKSEPPFYFFQSYRKVRADRFSGVLQMRFDNGWVEVRFERRDRNTGLIRFGGNEFTLQLGDDRNKWLDAAGVPRVGDSPK